MILTKKDWKKRFPITSVCRDDLRDCLTDKEIRTLGDKEMFYLAGKMAHSYLNHGFWSDLNTIVKEILKKKGKI